MESEAKERSLRKELVGPNIESELVPFTFSIDGGKGGEEVRQAPMAYVPDLVAKVVQLLDQNDGLVYTLILKVSQGTFFLHTRHIVHTSGEIIQNTYRVGRLTDHGFIPADEIWVKLGGDKGGSSMKVTFQILNCPHPNSPMNTCVFVAYEGPDSQTNLHVALDRYKSQVKDLQQLKWRYCVKFVLQYHFDCF